MFDHVVFLSKGETMYSGSPDEAGSFFSPIGYQCPPQFNSADWLMDMVSSEDEQVRNNMAKYLQEHRPPPNQDGEPSNDSHEAKENEIE
jgi:ABC-type multidrug transport system ATPase subunit